LKLTPTEEKLVQFMEGLEIIDAHEHLPPEETRVEQQVDVLTLFSHYTQTDLKAAGLGDEEYEKLRQADIPLDERWKLFKPYFDAIRYGSYARPALIAVRELYGFDDITDENYRDISAKMQQENTPGIYRRVLREKCNIRLALVQCGRSDVDKELFVPLMPLGTYANVASREQVERRAAALSMQVGSLQDYLALVEEELKRIRRDGVAGLKMSSGPVDDPMPEQAEQEFSNLMSGRRARIGVVNQFVTHRVLDIAADLGLVIAVHTGIIWNNWNDFYDRHPRHMIPILQKHRNTRFDIYHAGIPWVRVVAVMGKTFPNMWLNLCWCHIISPEMTCSALDEWLDLVPVIKILGFGGDYAVPVEKVYGHLKMAREDIARVLARRIERGLLDMDEAQHIATLWLRDNPARLYGLDS